MSFAPRAKSENRLFFIYVTVSGMREAKKIARMIVAERLAACANIIGGMHSLYWWNGKIEEAREVVLVFKTTKSQLDRLIARVTALHSYECPAIVALPIEAGFLPYLDWIAAETGAPPKTRRKARYLST